MDPQPPRLLVSVPSSRPPITVTGPRSGARLVPHPANFANSSRSRRTPPLSAPADDRGRTFTQPRRFGLIVMIDAFGRLRQGASAYLLLGLLLQPRRALRPLPPPRARSAPYPRPRAHRSTRRWGRPTCQAAGRARRACSRRAGADTGRSPARSRPTIHPRDASLRLPRLPTFPWGALPAVRPGKARLTSRRDRGDLTDTQNNCRLYGRV
jgi:hypothetical protein